MSVTERYLQAVEEYYITSAKTDSNDVTDTNYRALLGFWAFASRVDYHLLSEEKYDQDTNKSRIHAWERSNVTKSMSMQEKMVLILRQLKLDNYCFANAPIDFIKYTNKLLPKKHSKIGEEMLSLCGRITAVSKRLMLNIVRACGRFARAPIVFFSENKELFTMSTSRDQSLVLEKSKFIQADMLELYNAITNDLTKRQFGFKNRSGEYIVKFDQVVVVKPLQLIDIIKVYDILLTHIINHNGLGTLTGILISNRLTKQGGEYRTKRIHDFMTMRSKHQLAHLPGRVFDRVINGSRLGGQSLSTTYSTTCNLAALAQYALEVGYTTEEQQRTWNDSDEFMEDRWIGIYDNYLKNTADLFVYQTDYTLNETGSVPLYLTKKALYVPQEIYESVISDPEWMLEDYQEIVTQSSLELWA